MIVSQFVLGDQAFSGDRHLSAHKRVSPMEFPIQHPQLIKFLRNCFAWGKWGLVPAFLLFLTLMFGGEPEAVTCNLPCELPPENPGALHHAATALLFWLLWCSLGGAFIAAISIARILAKLISRSENSKGAQ